MRKSLCLQSNSNLTWDSSKCCKIISAIIPEMGYPMATLLGGLVDVDKTYKYINV